MKKAVISTTVPVSADTTTLSLIPQCNQCSSVYKGHAYQALCPVKELPDNNKENSNIAAACAFYPYSIKLVKKS